MSAADSPPSPSNAEDFLLPPQNIAPAVALEALANGELALHGLMPWSSNYTFLGTVTHQETKFNFIYKPGQGERPLWDFEAGSLCRREVAAYLVSAALPGWPAVPPTVFRAGPYGDGSIQQFIHADYNIHYFTLKDNLDFTPAFQKLALFDYLVNNADRKGGHCLLDGNNTLWIIDHGLTFHTDYKLRTVIWEYAGRKIPAGMLNALQNLGRALSPAADLYRQLHAFIAPAEIAGVYQRLENLLAAGRFPRPQGMQDYPYPPI